MKIIKRILICLLVLVLLVGAAFAAWRFLLRDGTTYLALADRLYDAGQLNWAVRCYRWAWAREPYSLNIPLQLAKVYADTGNYTKCEATLWDTIERMPGETELYTALSRVYVAQNKLLDASRLSEQITDAGARAAFISMQPAAPKLQPEGGEYDQDCTVSLVYTGGTAYWTLTGDYPSVETDRYTAPVQLVAQHTCALALVVGDNGLVSPAVCAEYSVGFINEPVTISDPALLDLLRQSMGWLDSAELTTGMLAEVESLTLPPEVEDLSALALMINLRELDATALNRTEDWSCLAGLTKLETLLLPPATLDTASLQTIGSLISLKKLTMAGCGLTTATPLEQLTALEELDLSNGSIGDCSALAGMSRMRVLRLGGNAVTDLQGIYGLSELEELDLHENRIFDFSPLRELKKLRVLNIASTGAQALGALVNLTSLEELDASGNQLSAINLLSRLTNLTKLNLSHNQIDSALPLAHLTHLVVLDLSSNRLSTLPDFDDACMLNYVRLDNNQLTEVSGLAELEYLNYVYLDYNQVEDLTPLGTCHNLVQIDAFENPTHVAQDLIDMGIIIHYTPVFDEETGEETTIEHSEEGDDDSQDTEETSDTDSEAVSAESSNT